LFLLASCKTNRQEIIPSAEYASYVNAYTGGLISSTSTIRVELTADLPMVELHSELKKNPFRFSPSLKGKAWWINNKTIEFVPEEEALKAGKLYEATFRLGDFVDVDPGMEKFTFTFRVAERYLDLHLEAPRMVSDASDRMQIDGVVRFSEAVDPDQVAALFSFKGSNGEQPSLIVTPGEHTDRYQFSITDIRRETKEWTLEVTVDGEALGISQIKRQWIVIPAIGDFSFLAAERITYPENGIRVTFSDPLSIDQDLRGLLSLPELKEYTFQVEGNRVDIYFEPTQANSYTLQIDGGIRNSQGQQLRVYKEISFAREASKPEVRLRASGNILPDSKNLLIPFDAVSLRAVDLTVVRIFESNVLMFLQDNSLSGSSELRRSGRMVYRKTLWLDRDPSKDLTRWEDFSIDLSGLIRQEPGAIYRVMLSFKPEYSLYNCGGQTASTDVSTEDMAEGLTRLLPEEDPDYDLSVWDQPSTYYYMENEGYDWRQYDWRQRDNPCHPSYYMLSSRKASCNVLATNLGLMIKQGEGNRVWAAVSDLLTTQPVGQAEVTLYNFQLRPIGQARTDAEGFAVIEAKGVPFVAVATHNDQKTYLKLIEGESLSVSRFDVGGKRVEKGLKGYIYGERGVWRPGDTLHVSFILEDREKRIPASHPVSFEIFTPTGQFYSKQISTRGENGFYTFHVPTRAEDPTGVWNAYVKVGGTAFHKSLRIETVKPNRLRANLSLPDKLLQASRREVPVTLSAAWLTGATASSLKADVELSLKRVHTQFTGYSNYIFNDPAAAFESAQEQVYKGTLNEKGDAAFTLKLPQAQNAPGLLQAHLTTRVYEPGGDASIQTVSIPYSPFQAYVGINLNLSKGTYIETDQDHWFDVVTVNGQGQPIDRPNLEYRIYKVDWSWWWENRNQTFESYIHNTSVQPVESGRISTTGGKGRFSFRVNYPDWGRYLVYVKDGTDGHATGGTVIIDWPDWRGRSEKSDPSGLTMLTFSTDKENYQAGEKATAYLPSAAGGRALVSIENGSGVLRREWVALSGSGDTKYTFEITPEMAPNVYLHVTLLQPHAQTANDLPIRMYGVVPVLVQDPASRLEPQIRMPEVLRPEQNYTVTVSEKKGQPMTYTLAVVDDGLLDLTSFRTPNPWDAFYAREALGVRTWDMYHQVIGAWSGNYGSLFSTGGDETLKPADAKANRFRPVVKFLGPFTLRKGESRKHDILLPMYVGSVRTMVVAGYEGAYGNAEQTTPVRSPLMVLSTLPRVLSTREEIALPVNVFAMEDHVKQVSVQVEISSNLTLEGGNKQTLTFSQPGDQLAMFRLKTGIQTGKATVKITATAGGKTATETVEVEIRNPNPAVVQHEGHLLQPGATVQMDYKENTSSKDSWTRLELSRIPAIDINRRFDFLYNYEHHCTEQLTSKALPLLFVDRFRQVDKAEQEKIRENVTEAIRRLYGRQLPDGGFIYWPGATSTDEWITSYAGNFLILAQERGYEVNAQVLNRWKSYQRRRAQNWVSVTGGVRVGTGAEMEQAYRLYTLALAGASEAGAMNRLRELPDLSYQARCRLAAAYALTGKKNIAEELLVRRQTEQTPSSYSPYSSTQRDEAMLLETLVLLGRDKEAFEQAQLLSRYLQGEQYLSTQSTAFSLMAMGGVAGKMSGSIRAAWSLNGATQPLIQSTQAIHTVDLPAAAGTVALTNQGEGVLYTSLITRRQLLNDTLPEISEGLKLEIRYTDVAGNPVSVEKLQQGSEFEAWVRVTNTTLNRAHRNLSLTHIVPSGWEIYNQRLREAVDDASDGGDSSPAQPVKSGYTYQDIRDDRVLTYFDLQRGASVTFRIRLQANYAGEFVLPAVQCEAMYEPTIRARTKAGRVSVQR